MNAATSRDDILCKEADSGFFGAPFRSAMNALLAKNILAQKNLGLRKKSQAQARTNYRFPGTPTSCWLDNQDP